MKTCPKCGRSFKRLLAVSRVNKKTMICDECGIMEALNNLPHGVITPQEQEKIKEAVAEVNRRQIENE